MIRETIDELDTAEMQNSCAVGATISKLTRQPTERKFLQIMYLIREWYPKHIKSS